MASPQTSTAVDISELDAQIAKTTFHLTGEAFLSAATDTLLNLLDAHIAFVTRALDYPVTRIAVVACTEPGFPSTFDLPGTPCEMVYAEKPVAIIEGVGRQFEPAEATGCEAFHGYGRAQEV